MSGAGRPLRIATRGSQLALWQAEHVKALLERERPGLTVELLIVKTTGDKILDVPLAQVGGKGLFVKEIEEALLDRRADLAVHSMKDLPTQLAPGLIMAAVSQRADPRDALCSRNHGNLHELPQGARVGTSSLRRMCQLSAARPDLRILALRGNVPTRLARLDAGDYDAVVLAVAGLERLGLGDRISEKALGVEARAGDLEIETLVHAAVHHDADACRVAAERAFLLAIAGGCQAPLAAHARFYGDELNLDALVGARDGTLILRTQRRGPAQRAEELGREAAQELLARGGDRLLSEAEVEAEEEPEPGP
jgi:hydroxymethylbilane synthase